MRKLKCLNILLALVVCVAFASCGEEIEGENFVPKEYHVSGRVEKGPFVSGSAITIQPMSEQMEVLGAMYSSTIQDHTGNFSFGTKLFESPYAELTANGYFFNEVTGQLSSGTLYLRAIVDLTKSETVNVNILTHIKYQRVMNLISLGKSYTEANNQAQEELFAAFGLQKYASKDASLYSIIEGTDESAALIAISSLILVDRSEAEITEYLARLCKEFADNGEFSNNTKEQIKVDREELATKTSNINDNICSRYNELGIEVKVKDLMYFFDWNDDGIAGNETLREGETISLETRSLEVPYSGGNYTIKIETPIPVYLEPLGLGDLPPSVVTPDVMLGNELYQFSSSADENISFEKALRDNILTINVSELNSYRSKSTVLPLYDCMGTVLDTITITQEANPNIAPPQCIGLGAGGSAVVGAIASELAKAVSEFNLIEQYYHYNKYDDVLTGCVDRYIEPNNSGIASMWESFYTANNRLLQMKHLDEQNADIYGEIIDVFSAMMYYYMVVGWGDVPYISNYEEIANGDICHYRTNQDAILDKIENDLKASIAVLEEKHNESLKLESMNEFFFISKDVARILLSNIYMYRNKYSNAEQLLADVINAGFYSLESDSYSNPETIDKLMSERTNKEVIFALYAEKGTRATRNTNIVITKAPLIPIMNYTDVLLSYAECLYHGGNTDKASEYLNQVVEAKRLEVAEGTFEGIKDARRQLFLYCNSNFAFYKRNGIAIEELSIKEHQLLLPIPNSELYRNPYITQNPGYDSN